MDDLFQPRKIEERITEKIKLIEKKYNINFSSVSKLEAWIFLQELIVKQELSGKKINLNDDCLEADVEEFDNTVRELGLIYEFLRQKSFPNLIYEETRVMLNNMYREGILIQRTIMIKKLKELLQHHLNLKNSYE